MPRELALPEARSFLARTGDCRHSQRRAGAGVDAQDLASECRRRACSRSPRPGRGHSILYDPWIQAEHPDWQVVNSPGEKPISVEQLKTSAVLGCWNSPYGDWFIKSQVALAKRLNWDGYNMDGFGCWSQCFCPYCEAAYKHDTGKAIPATGNVNDSEFRHYLKWRLDRYTHFVAKWSAALKAAKPGFVTAPWTTGPGRWWHWMGAPAAEGSDAMNRVLDAPMVELLWDFPSDQSSNLLPAFTVATIEPDGRSPCMDASLPLRAGPV